MGNVSIGCFDLWHQLHQFCLCFPDFSSSGQRRKTKRTQRSQMLTEVERCVLPFAIARRPSVRDVRPSVTTVRPPFGGGK